MCTSVAGTFCQYKLVHEIEVIERLIPNSDENHFIQLIKPGIILAVFTDNSGVDFYILKCISEVKQFKQATLDDLGNNSRAKVQVIEKGVFRQITCQGRYNNIIKLTKSKYVSIYLKSVRYYGIGVELRYRNFTMTDDIHETVYMYLCLIFPSYITCDSTAFIGEIT